MGTDIFIDSSGESAVEESAAMYDDLQETSAIEDFHAEAVCEEPDEILPLEFLENPELCSGVLPQEALNPGSNLLETVIITSEQMRRASAAGAVKPKLSSRRTAASSSGGSRRSKKINEEDLSPEELAIMRRNDRKAKLLIYAGLVVLALIFVALFTLKLPFYMHETFPNGIWPWSEIMPEYYQ